MYIMYIIIYYHRRIARLYTFTSVIYRGSGSRRRRRNNYIMIRRSSKYVICVMRLAETRA